MTGNIDDEFFAEFAAAADRSLQSTLQRVPESQRRVYLQALAAEGAARVDLDGEPVAPVSEKDRDHAAHSWLQFLKRRAEWKDARKARKLALESAS